MTPRDADPLRPPETDREPEPFRQRRAITVLALLAGLAILLLAYIAFSAATSRSSSDATIPVVSQATNGTPPRDTGVSAHGLGLLHPAELVSPTAGTVPPLCSPSPCPNAVQIIPMPFRNRRMVTGTASWFAAPDNEAAAGPGLRQALGARWRGTRVTVWTGSRCLPAVHGRPSPNCVVVTLTDWCQCGNGRVIDLDRGQFARLAPLSKGLVPVRVTW